VLEGDEIPDKLALDAMRLTAVVHFQGKQARLAVGRNMTERGIGDDVALRRGDLRPGFLARGM